MELFIASRFNDIEKVSGLLRNGVDVNMTNGCRQTALYVACRHGHHRLAEVLLAAGADPELGPKPLIVATKYCQRKCIELLLKHGADVNSTDYDGRSALVAAGLHRDYTTIELLLEFGADANIRFRNAKRERCFAEVLFCNAGREQLKLVEKLLDKGMVLLPGSSAVVPASRYAFRYGFRDFAVKMLELETDDNVKSYYAFALCACAIYNWPDVVTRLLDRGVNVNSLEAGQTALYIACREEHPEVVELLLQHGADPNLRVGNAKSFLTLPLQTAVAFGNTTIVQMLLSTNACVMPRNSGVLHIAVAASNLALAQLLLDSNVATIDCSDVKGRTALHRAAQSCNVEMVRWLILKQRADVNGVDRQNCTALHFACGLSDRKQKMSATSVDESHRLAVVKLLLENAANVDIVGRKRSLKEVAVTALYLAAKNGLVDVVAALLAVGAKPDVRIHLPALFIATDEGHVDIVKLLLASGADPNTNRHRCDRSLPTPLHVAIVNRRCDMIKLLLDHRASVNVIHSDGNYPLSERTMYAPLLAMVDLLEDDNKKASSECGPPRAKRSKCSRSDAPWRLFKRMLRAVRNVDIMDGNETGTAFHQACAYGLTDVARELLKRGASIDKLTPMDKSALFLACSNGHEDTVRFLLENNADVNMIHSTRDNKYRPLIMAATSADSLPIVKMLLCHPWHPDIDVNEKSEGSFKGGETALHVARSRPVAECLLAAGANPRTTGILDDTPLETACWRGHVGLAEALLSIGMNPNENSLHLMPLYAAITGDKLDVAKVLLAYGADPDRQVNYANHKTSSVLCYSCDAGNLAAVRMLLEAGASVNIVTAEYPETPLHYALNSFVHFSNRRHEPSKETIEEHHHIVDILLEYGADVNTVNSRNETALYMASHLGLKDVVVKLLERGADLELISRLKLKSPLSAACGSGNYDIVKLLLSHACCAADINRSAATVCMSWSPPSPVTALGEAASYMHAGIVDLLLKHGADASLRDDKTLNTPLHFACYSINEETDKIEKVFKALLSASADVDALNAAGETPLFVACKCSSCYTGKVEFLLVNGADPKKISADMLLETADRYGDMAQLKLLLAYGADVNARDSYQETVLHRLLSEFSERERFVEFCRSRCPRHRVSRRLVFEDLMTNVTLLISLGIDINVVHTWNHETALYLALKNKLFEIVKLLLTNGADPDASKNYNVPLCLAVEDGNMEMVQLLLEHGASPNVKPVPARASDANIGGTYPLITASLNPSKTLIARLLIDHGADLNVQDCNGETALHHAIVCNGELVKLLIDRGADPNIVSSSAEHRRLAPLHVACDFDRADIVASLLMHGADVNQASTHVHPLLVACRNSSTEIVEMLLKNGADPNLTSSCRDSSFLFPATFGASSEDSICENAAILPLSIAAFSGRYEVVQLLLDHGANVNAIDGSTGIAPLHAAVIGKQCRNSPDHLKVMITLVKSGADVNLTDSNGETALFLAVMNRCAEAVDHLLSNGADPNLGTSRPTRFTVCDKCSGGHCSQFELLLDPSQKKERIPRENCPSLPLGLAVCDGQLGGQLGVVESFLKHGADVNARDNEGLTVLQQVCKHFQPPRCSRFAIIQCVKLLLHNGADVHILDNLGRSVLGILLRTDHRPIWITDANCKVMFRVFVCQFIRHGLRIDDAPQNLQSVEEVRLLDFLTVDEMFWEFVVELIKAGSGFQILSLCCKLLSVNASDAKQSVTGTAIARAMIHAGYCITPAEMNDLQMAGLETDVSAEPNAQVALQNSCRLELLHWVMEHRPLNLRALSRIAVRRQLSVTLGYKDIRPHVSLLPLPEILKRFLVFEGDLTDVDLSNPFDNW